MIRIRQIFACVGFLVILEGGLVSAQVKDSVPFKIPDGWKARLFADHPLLSNPVAFCLDEQGRVFVAEEFRFNRGTEENRTRPFLLEDDLQIKTLDDRLAMYRKHASKFDGGMSWFNRYSDRVRMVEDRDGDGKADRSTVFADGFNGTLDGLAAGVIARDGDVYLTNIPSLWRLRDRDGDGIAESREALLTGFGVNAGFLGHDLHGLVWGPDGRLYFSVGDRGFHVKTKEGGVISGPRRGGVFRCEPDGSHLELVAQGMRNPQELAFDAYGRLFAADNNCDKGDDSRLVYVVEGGDSGWNMAYQTIPSPYLTGPWHAEKLWHLAHEGQAACIVPPVGKLGAGPSGFAAYPGVGLPSRYANHFFYCNFTGNGGVEAFAVRPRGASFEIHDHHQVVTPINASDVDFGYDGRLYLTDYGKLEWDGSNDDGRIYTVESPAVGEAAGVARLFREGFRQRSEAELIRLLGHLDMRVRLRAQFALAERGPAVAASLGSVLRESTDRFTRLHAAWAVGQIARVHSIDKSLLIKLAGDPDPILRSASIKILGELRDPKSVDSLISGLSDDDDQVKFASAIALGRLGNPLGIAPMLAFLGKTGDADPYLRHAGVMGLLGAAGPRPIDRLWENRNDSSRAVRLAITLVCRRVRDARIAEFLKDSDLLVRTEAARAIHDLAIESAEPALADSMEPATRFSGESGYPLIRRVLNANLRVGKRENAQRVAEFIANTARSIEMRREALAVLTSWTEPASRDRVNGFWYDIPKRDPQILREVVSRESGRLIGSTSGEMRVAVLELIQRSGADFDLIAIGDLVTDAKAIPEVRIAALRLVASRKPANLGGLIEAALRSEHPRLRAEAGRRLSEIDPKAAFELLSRIVRGKGASLIERREALDVLAALPGEAPDGLFADLLTQLREGKVEPEVELDLVESAASRKADVIAAALRAYESSIKQDDPIGGFRSVLVGGDADRGRSIFIDNPQAQCMRCHRVGNQGGSAGPNLSEVGRRLDRQAILVSLLNPDAVIAQGFGRTSLALADGRVITGTIKSESAHLIQIELPNGRLESIKVADVEERTPPKSAMPKAGAVLSKKQLRDVVSFLAGLK